jgi:hypothetical protein
MGAAVGVVVGVVEAVQGGGREEEDVVDDKGWNQTYMHMKHCLRDMQTQLIYPALQDLEQHHKSGLSKQ